MNCICCVLKNLINSIKNMTVTCNCTCDIPQPLEVTGNINVTSSQSSDPCVEANVKILSSASSFNEIIFTNGEQYQNASNVVVDGYIVSFNSQGQTIKAPVCSIEYVTL